MKYLKNKINQIIFKINKLFKKNCIFYLILLLYLVLIDFFNRYLVLRTFNIFEYFQKEALIFNFFWVTILLIIIYIFKALIKRIITLILTISLFLFSIINYFINAYFGSVFSWKDLILSGDGLSFINSILKFINVKLIIFIIICLSLIICIFYLSNHENKYKIKSTKTIILVILISILFVIYHNNNIKLSQTSEGWDAAEILNNKSNYYTNWISPNKLILIGGTYDYIFRDFYISFLKKENINISYKNVEEYINNHKNINLENNEYTGIFKDKNLIFVMMESMDDWMISKETTPTIYKMMHHGFNFINHYSPVYVTGSTANTEFIANTGIYPNINHLSPNYAYNTNTFSYSLPNLFKNSGYTVNSFHRSNAHIYNREQMHNSFGYEVYHNYFKMGISEKYLDLDSYIAIEAYEKIVSSDKFMSFIITYSPHTPYNYSKIECNENLEEIKKLKLEEDEEKLCAYSSARETDNMFKILLKKLEEDNILEDTVIIAFTDHPNNIVFADDETEKLNKTIFFIYNNEMKNNQISDISSTIDILPTVKNLFGLNSDFIYPGCDLMNCKNNNIIFSDYTYYNGKEILPLKEEHIEVLNFSKDLLISDYYK